MIKSNSTPLMYLSLLFFASILLNSCYVQDPEPTQIIDIENDLGLDLIQKLNTENDYYWLISTNESDFCGESQLITEYTKEDGFDVLIIRGIETPNKCSSYNSTIRSVEEITLDTPYKNLIINLANKVTYSSVVSKEDDMITITSESQNAFSPGESYLQRVEANHMWGGLHFANEQNKALFFSLYQEITEQVVYEQVEQGNHGYFSYKNSSLNVMNPESFETSEIGFAIKLEDEFVMDETKIENLILDFRMSHPEVDFFISLGNGKQF